MSHLDLVRRSCPLHHVDVSPSRTWVLATPRKGWRLRDQGWKLHVSAGPQPTKVLRRCLDILGQAPVHFKVLATRGGLVDLSCGNGGLSQVGKFITVYPHSEREAVLLAQALDAGTVGCQGPAIASDRPLRPGSLVYYRYGCFSDRTVVTRMGTREPAVRAPDGRWLPAAPRPHYEQPPWASNPFPAEHLEPSGSTEIIASRFVPIRALARSARGRTMLAIDTRDLRRCVLKEALPWVVLGRDGSDARARLVYEAAVLARIAHTRVGPAPYGVFEHRDARYLSMEDIGGASFADDVSGSTLRLGPPDGRTVARVGRRLAHTVALLHSCGLVHRDLKPANVIRDGRRYRLIDFELCLPAGAAAAWGTGTDGYMSRRQRAGSTADPADDIYALGCLLVFAATGADPSASPAGWRLNPPPLKRLNPSLPAALIDVIEWCLDEAPARRPRDARIVADRFRTWLSAAPAARSSLGMGAHTRPGAATPCGFRREFAPLTRRLARRLEAELRAWTAADGQAPLFLNDGVAGGLLVMSEVLRRDPARTDATLLHAVGVRLLDDSRPGRRNAVPGLCVGAAGVAAAAIRAGLVLSDRELTARGRRRAMWALEQPPDSPDFFHGAAGRLWLGLQLSARWPAAHLDAIIRSLGDHLSGRRGRAVWAIPEGYPGLSGQQYYGFAHGIAGIGSVLHALYRRTGRQRYCAAARRADRQLRRAARTTLADGRGLTWPVSDRDPALPGPFWCHGPVGVGAFFLELWADGRDPQALDAALAAARSAVRCGRWMGTSQCHGLAGTVEFLLDGYQVTRDRAWRDLALGVGALLANRLDMASRQELARSGLGLFTGFPGALAALLRLAEPETGLRLLGPGFLVGAIGRAEATSR